MKSYLMHHGILGQKWGKRNGPPYPLKPSDHSAAEKKKQKSEGSDKKKSSNNSYDVSTKSYSNEYVEGKTHTIKSKNQKGSSKIEDMMRDPDGNIDEDWMDFDAADVFDIAGANALSIYEDTGDIKKAVQFLEKQLQDIPYEFAIYDEKYVDDGERYVGFQLKAFGDKYYYQTQGDSGYTDEQWFYKR